MIVLSDCPSPKKEFLREIHILMVKAEMMKRSAVVWAIVEGANLDCCFCFGGES